MDRTAATASASETASIRPSDPESHNTIQEPSPGTIITTPSQSIPTTAVKSTPNDTSISTSANSVNASRNSHDSHESHESHGSHDLRDPEAARPTSEHTTLLRERDTLVLQLLASLPTQSTTRSDKKAETSSHTNSKHFPTTISEVNDRHPEEQTSEKNPVVRSSTETSPPTQEQITLALHHARETNQTHIRSLQEYNEIKDVARGLFGICAETRGVRVVDVMRMFGVGNED